MKLLDRIILTIYSIIILIESILSIFLIFGWVDIQNIVELVKDILNNYTTYNILFAISIIFIIFSIKAILFYSESTEEDRKPKKQDKLGEGVLLENDDGKLLISKETIERIANGTIKGFQNIKDARIKVFIDSKNKIAIVIELQIIQNTVIKDLNTNLQTSIKEAIKNATDLDVNEINIKVKNIIPVAENSIEDDEEE